MNRGQKMRGFTTGRLGGAGGKASIKDRIGGVPKAKAGNLGTRRGGISTQGKFIASRLGLPIKNRVGLNVKGVGLKRLGLKGSDARDKIILNRVSRVASGGTGKITDARSKIEAKRTTKTPLRTGGAGGGGSGGKVKSLKITAKLSGNGIHNNNSPNPRPPTYSPMASSSSSSIRYAPVNSYRSAQSIPQVQSAGLFAHIPDSYSPHHPQPHHPPPSVDKFLTRTVQNPTYQPQAPVNRGGWTSSVAKVAPTSYSSSRQYEDMDMEEEPPSRLRLSNSLQSRLDSHDQDQPRYKLIVSNLQATVTTEDIAELFSDIASPISATMTSPGHAEVIYSKKSDCIKAVDAYHNRLLDGMPMRVFMENASTGLKSAAGATMKLPKSGSSVKIQPDISAIHKVLFNPSSSAANSTRGSSNDFEATVETDMNAGEVHEMAYEDNSDTSFLFRERNNKCGEETTEFCYSDV